MSRNCNKQIAIYGINYDILLQVTILSWQPWSMCNVTNCNQTGIQYHQRICLVDGIVMD